MLYCIFEIIITDNIIDNHLFSIFILFGIQEENIYILEFQGPKVVDVVWIYFQKSLLLIQMLLQYVPNLKSWNSLLPVLTDSELNF